jgi:pimeloyl-ACP methyl ester carboxylesterase
MHITSKAIAPLFVLALSLSGKGQKKVDIGGYSLHLNCSERVSQRGPTVILEAGLNQDSRTWDKVHPAVARFARVCSYDRAGIGRSDPPPSGPVPTSQLVVEQLRRLLEKAGINGPLVLVGHSFGGANVRLYASVHPKDVAGMVLVDAVHEDETEKWLAMLPAETRERMAAAGGGQLLGEEKVDLEASMKQLKAAAWRTRIPLIVLARGRASFDPDNFPPALRALAPKGEQLRIEMQKDLAQRSTRGTFQFAERSGHMIHQDEPELVVEAIRRIVKAAVP